MNDVRTVLFCTVGGSHQPIVAAIRNIPAERFVFFCTDRDPATGRQGSISQITGQGPVIRQDPSDPVPTLPNIPAQTGLAAERCQAVIVPADELDPAVAAMHGTLLEWRQRARPFPGVRRLAVASPPPPGKPRRSILPAGKRVGASPPANPQRFDSHPRFPTRGPRALE